MIYKNSSIEISNVCVPGRQPADDIPICIPTVRENTRRDVLVMGLFGLYDSLKNVKFLFHATYWVSTSIIK